MHGYIYLSAFWLTLIALYITLFVYGDFDILSCTTGLYTTGVLVITAMSLKSKNKTNAER